MTRPRASLLLLAVVLTGCGYPGDPLPPALNIPLRVQDLNAVQRGNRVILQFTPEFKTTDHLILNTLGGIDLRGGPSPEGEFNLDAWAASARRFDVAETSKEQVTIEAPVNGWVGRDVVFGVQTKGPTGRSSGWSNLVTLKIVAPLPQPQSVTVENHPDGVALRWQPGEPAQGQWRVYRAEKGKAEYQLLGHSQETQWVDRTSEYGKSYLYVVQRFTAAGDTEAESEPANPVTIEPADVFAPAVPSGLRVFAGVRSIEVAWEANTDKDFAAYQVWRAEGDAALAKYGERRTVPSLSDTGVESGKSYRYAISAIDSAGNESQPSTPVEFKAP